MWNCKYTVLLLFISRILLILVIVVWEAKEYVVEEPPLGCFANSEKVRFSEVTGKS